MQITFIHYTLISWLKCTGTCQLNVNQAESSDVEKSFLFSDFAVKAAKSGNKKGF